MPNTAGAAPLFLTAMPQGLHSFRVGEPMARLVSPRKIVSLKSQELIKDFMDGLAIH